VQTSLSYQAPAAYLCEEPKLKKVNRSTGPTEQSELLRIGDESAFEQIFRQFHPALCRYAFTIVKDLETAEEIVQDVFLKVWEKRESLVITVSMKSYLYRAVHNTSLNLLEKKKKEIRMDEAPMKIVHQSAAPVADLQTKELEKAIADALTKLPEQCRKVFELSRFGELKYSEIAAVLGISIKTVENQMGKALRIMREQLAPYLPFLLPFFFYNLNLIIPVL
jgi:RNA polymerase sigma-70 factor (family 1)